MTVNVDQVRLSAVIHYVVPTSLLLRFGEEDQADAERDGPALLELLGVDLMTAKFLLDRNGQHAELTMSELLAWARGERGYDPTQGADFGQEVDSTLAVDLVRDLGRELFVRMQKGRCRRVVGVEILFRAHRRREPLDLARHAYDGTMTRTRVVSGEWASPDRKDQFKFMLAVDERGMRGEAVVSEAPHGVA